MCAYECVDRLRQQRLIASGAPGWQLEALRTIFSSFFPPVQFIAREWWAIGFGICFFVLVGGGEYCTRWRPRCVCVWVGGGPHSR